MTSHSYNTRNNSLVLNGNYFESRFDNSPATLDTFELVVNFERKMLARFDGLDKEPLNIKRCHNKRLTN